MEMDVAVLMVLDEGGQTMITMARAMVSDLNVTECFLSDCKLEPHVFCSIV
jgi:hypothetical protein